MNGRVIIDRLGRDWIKLCKPFSLITRPETKLVHTAALADGCLGPAGRGVYIGLWKEVHLKYWRTR
jgi:hypothetical protein